MKKSENTEQLLEHLQPSIVVILLRIVAAMFVLDTLYALFIFAFYGLYDLQEWHDSYILGLVLIHTVKFVVITAIVIKLFVDWASRGYYLSGHQLIEKVGILNRTEITHDLSQVKEVVIKRSWLGRKLNYGTIILTLAGSSATQDVYIRDVKDAVEYKRYFDKHLQVQGWVR